MEKIKCNNCGRFISEQDIVDGKCDQKDQWSWDKMELIDVFYFCPKCSAKDPSDEK